MQKLLGNPKFLIALVASLIVLFVISGTAAVQLPSNLLSSWLQQLGRGRPVTAADIRVHNLVPPGCARHPDLPQLHIAAGQICDFSVSPASGTMVPASRLLTMTLESGAVNTLLQVELQFPEQRFPVQVWLPFRWPVGVNLPAGGAELSIAGCSAVKGSAQACILRIGEQ